MKVAELVNSIYQEPDAPLALAAREVVTVDEDGFVRDVVGVSYDPETGVFMLRLEIKKKNGEIE